MSLFSSLKDKFKSFVEQGSAAVAKQFAKAALKWGAIGAITALCPPAGVALAVASKLCPDSVKEKFTGLAKKGLEMAIDWVSDKIKEKACDFFKEKVQDLMSKDEQEVTTEQDPQGYAKQAKEKREQIRQTYPSTESSDSREAAFLSEVFERRRKAEHEQQTSRAQSQPYQVTFYDYGYNMIPFLLGLERYDAQVDFLPAQSPDHVRDVSVTFRSARAAEDFMSLLSAKYRFKAKHEEADQEMSYYYAANGEHAHGGLYHTEDVSTIPVIYDPVDTLAEIQELELHELGTFADTALLQIEEEYGVELGNISRMLTTPFAMKPIQQRVYAQDDSQVDRRFSATI